MNTDTFPVNNTEQIAIRELQTMLRFLSRYNASIPAVNVDGVFGEETENAVRAFQKLAGLPENGVVDINTWNKIVEELLISQNANFIPHPVFIFPPEITAFSPGDSFDEVIILQLMLKRLADRYDNIPLVDITGVYDPKTKEAVEKLQEIFNLPPTGEVNRETWNKITSLYSVLTGND